MSIIRFLDGRLSSVTETGKHALPRLRVSPQVDSEGTQHSFNGIKFVNI